jgi:hypothetical protein
MAQQSSTPFVQTALGTMLGFGAPLVQYYDSTALTATGTITLTGWTGPAITKGKLRIKSAAVNAATTIAIGNITATDGTNTVIIKGTALATTSAGSGLFDFLYEWASDLQVTSISFTVTLAGSSTIATIDSELFANP